MPTPQRTVLRQMTIAMLSAVLVVVLYLRSTRPEPPTIQRTDVARRMSRHVTLDLTDQPLGDALRDLSEQVDVPFDVDWTELSDLDVTPATPVSLRLRHVDGATAITTLLRQTGAGAGWPYLGWSEDIGRIRITSGTALGTAVVRAYGVGDLLEEDAAFRRAMPNEVRELSYPMRRVRVGWSPEKPREESIEDLQIIVMHAVSDGSWIQDGGTVGQMAFAFDRLVVAQTPENHERIQRVLAAMRARDPIASGGVNEPKDMP